MIPEGGSDGPGLLAKGAAMVACVRLSSCSGKQGPGLAGIRRGSHLLPLCLLLFDVVQA